MLSAARAIAALLLATSVLAVAATASGQAPEPEVLVPEATDVVADPVGAPALDVGARLETARALYFAAEFEPALTAFRAITADPAVTHEQLVEALRYLVPLEQTLGRPMDAAECARALLALEPDTTLPDGSPASAIEGFESLRAAVAPAELRLTLTETRASVALARPLGALPTLDLECDTGSPSRAEGPSSTELSVELDPLRAAACDATARTSAGARILVAHAERGIVVHVAELAPETQAPPVPFPWLEIGVGSASVAVAIVVVVLSVVLATQSSTVSLPAPSIAGW